VRACFTVRHPVMWICTCLVLIAMLAVLIAGGYVARTGEASRKMIDAVMTDAGFGISSIRIAGNHRSNPDDILAALGFAPGQSIFSADVQAARLHLRSLEWVADARVRRQYPDLITVSIVEKLPFALWETPNGSYVVERSGRTIGLFDPHTFPHLPAIFGAGAPQNAAEIIDAVAAHRATSARVAGYARISERRWNLLLNDDVIVELPEEGWARELDVLEHLIVDTGVLERDVSEIDLRLPDNYFFVLRNGQKQQMKGNAT
jgi:cell division protein FtsQ